jgi:hypothetical protein
MAKYKTCDRCGSALDFGESCTCPKPEHTPKKYISRRVAKIPVEWSGSAAFSSKMETATAQAGLTGLTALVSEYSKLIGVPVPNVLAIMGAVMMRPNDNEAQT